MLSHKSFLFRPKSGDNFTIGTRVRVISRTLGET
jgi:hypothetical protein